MTTAIGTRVRLTAEVDNYPTVLAPAGLTGTLVEIDDEGSYWIKLDEYRPELEEWENKIQIWDYSPENDGKYHPETYLEAI